MQLALKLFSICTVYMLAWTVYCIYMLFDKVMLLYNLQASLPRKEWWIVCVHVDMSRV